MKLFNTITFIFVLHHFSWAQLSPGDLHKSHADLEGVKNCTRCHETGKKLSADNCLSCHSILRQQIQDKRGLHSQKGFDQCETCHVEHQGRDFNLIYWENGQEAFDHSQTGYVLSGAHSRVKCRECHKSGNISDSERYLSAGKDLNRTFLGLARECLSCHKDEHRGQTSGSCMDCHNLTAWKPAGGFDHKNSSFPLTGRHISVDCIKCHSDRTDKTDLDDVSRLKFKPVAHKFCTDCHADVHTSRFGKNCQNCHSTSGWKTPATQKFDHNLTRYPLEGKHASLSCPACHKPGQPLKIKKYGQCRDCHSDFHQGDFKQRKLKGACEECHSVSGFSPSMFTISQHAQTGYPLDGAHLAVPCFACHKKQNSSIKIRFPSARCQACHQDPHHNQVDRYLSTISTQTNSAGCEHCHKSSSWTDLSFNHDLTKFSLTGRHSKIKCSACHRKDSLGIIQIKLTESTCQACHDDIHRGQFISTTDSAVTSCSSCHTPENWLAAKFDHNRHSRFPLKGRHAVVSCGKCHKKTDQAGVIFTLFRPMSTDCKSCHGSNLQESQDEQQIQRKK